MEVTQGLILRFGTVIFLSKLKAGITKTGIKPVKFLLHLVMFMSCATGFSEFQDASFRKFKFGQCQGSDEAVLTSFVRKNISMLLVSVFKKAEGFGVFFFLLGSFLNFQTKT